MTTKAQRTADNIDLMLGNFPGPDRPIRRQHMLDRFEFLALKKEAKGLTQKEYSEMQWLRHPSRYPAIDSSFVTDCHNTELTPE